MKRTLLIAALGLLAGVAIGLLPQLLDVSLHYPFIALPGVTAPFAKRGCKSWDWLADHLDELTGQNPVLVQNCRESLNKLGAYLDDQQQLAA